MRMKVQPTCKTRKEYIEYCKLMIKDKRAQVGGKLVYQYKNNSKGQRQGVVCAFVRDDKLYVGASRCNRKLHDKFDSHIGLWQALQHAVCIPFDYPENYADLGDGPGMYVSIFNESFPYSLQQLVCRMIFRARRQFNKKPDPTPEPTAA